MLKKLKRLCSSLWRKLKSNFKKTSEEESDSANTITFEKLTPTHIDNLGIYKDALDFALNSDDIKNIAITGDYGAGKSSVLLTYENLHPERKFIHISLAHFDDNNTNSKDLTSHDSNQAEQDFNRTHINEAVIEGKILNQLIHQINPGKIPQTNFKIKKAIIKPRLIMASIATTIYLMLLIYVFNFDKWCAFVSSENLQWLGPILKWTANDSVRLFALIVICILSAWLIYFLIKLQKTRNVLKKLNVQGAEIELFDETNDSFFDKYLNEVLYLFENIDADIIVFEDIDRFDDIQIFERLREINTLANLQRKQSHKGIIRFFYLLKDDIFTSKDRTKFFDYIMPIIPVIDGSNSYNKFISQLKAIDMYDKLDEHFIQDLSLYVDDMRLLKNICNEFQIYQSKLNTIELDNNKMLAIITYKNLFPRDFSDLQLRKGFVYTLFANKSIFVQEEISRIDNLVAEKRKLIKQLEGEILDNRNDVENALAGLKSKIPSYSYHSDYEKNKKEYETWRDKIYPEKMKLIEQKEAGNIAKINQEIENLSAELQHIEGYPLSKIITKDNIAHIFEYSDGKSFELSYKDVKNNNYFDLLKYLIRNGYIDETYPDYMTYFYKDSLSVEDKLFLRSIADQKRKEYAYNITAPSKVLSRLRPVDFEKEEALNFTLTEYLFSHNSEYIDYIKSEITQLKAGKHFDFIDDYLSRDKGIGEFVAVVIPQWPELFSIIIPGNKLSSVNIKKLVISAIYSCRDGDLLNANVENVITDYISSAPDFLNISSPCIDRLISAFSFLKVSFHSLDYAKSDTALFNAVYESGCYDLTFQNIDLMLKKMYHVDSEYDIRHKNLTLIMKNPESPLAAKVHLDMNVYMEVIIAECDGSIYDDEPVMIGILNDESIDGENKDNYCSVAKTKIQLLGSIYDKGTWFKWIEAKIVEICEKNVIDYFLYTGKIDNVLISFINNTDEYTFNFERISEDYSSNFGDFFEHIVKCNELIDRAYREILESLGYEYENFSLKGLNTSKVAILIDLRIIKMGASSLRFMRTSYSDCVRNYIRKNIDEYINLMLMDSSLFKSEELLAVLSMDVQVEQKLALLKFMRSPVSVVGKGYPDKVIEYILENNLNENDVPFLFNEYKNYPPSVQNAILKIAVKKINTLINRPDGLSCDLIRDIMHHDGLSAKIKFNLLIVIFPSLDKSSTIDYLSLADKGEFADIFDSQKRPKFADDPDNQKLLKAFKDKGLIHEYYKNNDGLWQIRRREQRKKK